MVRRLVWTHAVHALRHTILTRSPTFLERWRDGHYHPNIVLYCTVGLSAIDDSHYRTMLRFRRRSRLVRQLLPLKLFMDTEVI